MHVEALGLGLLEAPQIYAGKIWDACEAVALCWKAVWAAVDARDGGYFAKALPLKLQPSLYRAHKQS